MLVVVYWLSLGIIGYPSDMYVGVPSAAFSSTICLPEGKGERGGRGGKLWTFINWRKTREIIECNR